MSTQRIDLPILNLELLWRSSTMEPLAPEETVVKKKEPAAPDEFEVRRKAFFTA
jgi:hypothetical protein